METFQSLFTKKLAAALAAAGFDNVGQLAQATDPRFGDYQTNAALVLGKQRSESPRNVAAKILEHLSAADLCESPTVAGAGFINFTLLPGAVADKTAELFADERLGVARSTSTKKTLISGTSASRSRCRIFSTFTNSSTFITTSSAAKAFTTIACPASSSGCLSPASPRLAKARSSFSFVIFPSWRTSRASFARATADSITPPATSRRLIIESPN